MANSDWFQWYLITIGGIEDWPTSFGPKLGLFRPKFGLKFGFRLILQHWLIRYVWFFRFWFLSMLFNYHWCYLRLTQIFRPTITDFRPKFILKFGFHLIYWHQNVQFLFLSTAFNVICIQNLQHKSNSNFYLLLFNISFLLCFRWVQSDVSLFAWYFSIDSYDLSRMRNSDWFQ